MKELIFLLPAFIGAVGFAFWVSSVGAFFFMFVILAWLFSLEIVK